MAKDGKHRLANIDRKKQSNSLSWESRIFCLFFSLFASMLHLISCDLPRDRAKQQDKTHSSKHYRNTVLNGDIWASPVVLVYVFQEIFGWNQQRLPVLHFYILFRSNVSGMWCDEMWDSFDELPNSSLCGVYIQEIIRRDWWRGGGMLFYFHRDTRTTYQSLHYVIADIQSEFLISSFCYEPTAVISVFWLLYIFSDI